MMLTLFIDVETREKNENSKKSCKNLASERGEKPVFLNIILFKSTSQMLETVEIIYI
jgi:hypothetical protein